MVDTFDEAPYLFLGGDEVNYHCFDQEPSVAAWMKTHCADLGCCSNGTTCSLQMLDYFWKRFAKEVVPQFARKVPIGVWLADPGNTARGWNPPSLDALPGDTLFNV